MFGISQKQWKGVLVSNLELDDEDIEHESKKEKTDTIIAPETETLISEEGSEEKRDEKKNPKRKQEEKREIGKWREKRRSNERSKGRRSNGRRSNGKSRKTKKQLTKKGNKFILTRPTNS